MNRDGARAVAEGAKQGNSRLLHVSTDFIFAGDRSLPYTEADTGTPISVYGQSKWEGEQAVRELMPEALIVRTAWVYGVHGNNFVKTMLRLMAEREEIRVVDDQIGTPSWTADIVTAMRTLIDKDVSGTWNFTNEGVTSWFDFAHEIISIAAQLGHRQEGQAFAAHPQSRVSECGETPKLFRAEQGKNPPGSRLRDSALARQPSMHAGGDAFMKTLLVTGGAGFIGANFVRYWLEHHPGDRVINLDALTYAGNLENLAGVEANDNYRFVHGDICDASLLSAAVR